MRSLSRKKKFLYSCVMLVLVVVVLEASLQLLSIASTDVGIMLAVNNPFPAMVDEQLGHRPSPAHPEHDERGFRNRVALRRAEVVILGDSQTYGTGVAPDETWPRWIEALGVGPTYAMAYGGYGPTHSVVLIDEALELRPKVVIEAMYSGNDLFDCQRMVYNGDTLPGWRSSDPAVLREVEEHVIRSAGTSSGTPVHKNLKLFALARLLKDQFFKEVWQTIQWRATAMRGGPHIAFEAGGIRTTLTPAYRMRALNLDDPLIREGHRIALEAIASLHDRAVANEAEFVVVLIPTKELVFTELARAVSKPVARSFWDLVEQETLMWEQTKCFLNERNIAFVDQLPALRECLDRGVCPYQINFDGHPNAEGHRAIAEHTVSYLRERGLVMASREPRPRTDESPSDGCDRNQQGGT